MGWLRSSCILAALLPAELLSALRLVCCRFAGLTDGLGEEVDSDAGRRRFEFEASTDIEDDRHVQGANADWHLWQPTWSALHLCFGPSTKIASCLLLARGMVRTFCARH